MASWDEYKTSARERGALALELFVVESTAVAPPDEMRAVLPRHLAYQQEMEAAGTLFLAGPLSDVTGETMPGTGLIVYRAASLEDARAIADRDPMHAEGKRTYTLRKWLVNEGALDITVALSGQAVRLR